MKNKKYITLGFVSVTVALSLLMGTTLFANSLNEETKKESSRLESLAKFTKVIR